MKHEIKFTTYLKDSNASGNTYFARYFDWQGMLREDWCVKCIDSKLMSEHGALLTKEAHNTYIKETFPFDEVTGVLQVLRYNAASLTLGFEFFSKDELVAKGGQTIILAKDGKVKRFPKEILNKFKLYANN